MGSFEFLLEIALVGLLAATLIHALRLEKALGVLKQDRAALEQLVAGFNASTRQAESGVEQLRAAADGAGKQVARQVDAARALQGDLVFLIERGERVADRLDGAIRAARPLLAEPVRESMRDQVAQDEPRLRSQAERDLLRALRIVR